MKAIVKNFEGIIADLSNELYHASAALGSTQIKSATKSLAHFKAMTEGRVEITASRQEAFDLGNCAHAANLEQTTDIFVCVPEDAPTRPNSRQLTAKKPSPETVAAIEWWKKFDEENAGKIQLKPEQKERVVEMFNAFVDHPVAPNLVSSSKVEQSFFFIDQETGLWCKARPDGYGQDDINGDFIFDFKTISRSSAKPKDFAKQSANLGYHISAAHYIAGVEKITGRKVQDYFFIVQETTAPYAMMIYRASDLMLKSGETARRMLLNQISIAYQTNDFPGYPTTIEELNLPAWSLSEDHPSDFGVAL